MACPACREVIPPEFPLEQWPFCMNCGTQIGPVRFDQAPADPYPPRNDFPPQRGDYPPPRNEYPPQRYDPPPREEYPPQRYDPPVREEYPPQRYEPPAPAGPPRLVLESGIGKVEYPLDTPVITIGRSRSNDISLEDSRVSRYHARVVRDGTGFFVEDLKSRNGTRVDDRAVRDSAPLSDGSVIRIGDSVFRFTEAAAAAQPARPVPGPSPFSAPQADWNAPRQAPGAAAAPEVFVSPWSPVQCPSCQGLKTMRPIVYGPAAQTPGAQAAARRGEVALGEGPATPNGPNAECRACSTRVRIVNTGG